MQFLQIFNSPTLIVRPKRNRVQEKELGNFYSLGDKQFILHHTPYFRIDYSLYNQTKHQLKCTLFSPKPQQLLHLLQTCIIFCHCNTGNRLEGLQYLNYCGQFQYGLLLFDFSGCGNSQGDFITLGLRQSLDIQSVIQNLRQKNNKIRIVLWGRSMGAIACLLYLSEHQKVECSVFDSPFLSMQELTIEIIKKQIYLPNFICYLLFQFIRNKILNLTGYDIYKLQMRNYVQKITVPALFVISEVDQLVPIKQMDQLYAIYKHQKEYLMIHEGHFEKRGEETINKIFSYIKSKIRQSSVVENPIVSIKPIKGSKLRQILKTKPHELREVMLRQVSIQKNRN